MKCTIRLEWAIYVWTLSIIEGPLKLDNNESPGEWEINTKYGDNITQSEIIWIWSEKDDKKTL